MQLSPPGACFVSLKSGGRLRGCVGTLSPTQPSLEQEVVSNAVAASTRDPRFAPVRSEEVALLQVSIDILGALELIASPAQLDPSRYGLIVRSGTRCGVLLPDLPGVHTASQQEQICREKAGIHPRAQVTLSRFVAQRIEE